MIIILVGIEFRKKIFAVNSNLMNFIISYDAGAICVQFVERNMVTPQPKENNQIINQVNFFLYSAKYTK